MKGMKGLKEDGIRFLRSLCSVEMTNGGGCGSVGMINGRCGLVGMTNGWGLGWDDKG